MLFQILFVHLDTGDLGKVVGSLVTVMTDADDRSPSLSEEDWSWWNKLSDTDSGRGEKQTNH